MNKIIKILKKKKFVTLDQFINISLYDKKFGYYMKNNPFGSSGDFITSPLVSNLFSEMLAIWCIAFWEHLEKPKKILLVELGPGDGSLCKDLLKTFKKFKIFYDCLSVNLLEISTKLKSIQKSNINNNKVKWIKNIDKINSGPIIFIGNEFFDSLPIKHIYKTKNNFFEKYISWSNKDQNIKTIYKPAKKKLIYEIKNKKIHTYGKLIEYPVKALEYLEKISEKIKKFNGGLLTFDYGYSKKRTMNTLQSVQNHRYTDILSNPGKADLTSHVNFEIFKNVFKTNNLRVEKIITQNEFLQKMGILKRAEIISKKMNFRKKADMFYRLKKLLHPNEMGALFKVMFVHKKNKKFSLGF
jgi:NADH dehydrogenase [ubiquinone] 1 alpha subcomplex assembly factor 7